MAFRRHGQSGTADCRLVQLCPAMITNNEHRSAFRNCSEWLYVESVDTFGTYLFNSAICVKLAIVICCSKVRYCRSKIFFSANIFCVRSSCSFSCNKKNRLSCSDTKHLLDTTTNYCWQIPAKNTPKPT
jgi:hypothetical protein